MRHLLLLHGALGSKKQYNELKKRLDLYYHVHTLDFSGHGENAPYNEDFSIPLFANDVARYLNEKNLKDVGIFGYSMGGYVALYLARHRPEYVNSVFTVNTKMLFSAEQMNKEAEKLNPRLIKEKVPHYANYLAQLHSHKWEKLMLKTAAFFIDMAEREVLSKFDFNAIQRRVLIASGDNDKMVDIAETMFAFENILYSELLIMPATEHSFEKLSQDRLEFEIRRFFKN